MNLNRLPLVLASLLLFVGCCLADEAADRAEITKLLAGPGVTIDPVKIAETWALAGWSGHDSGGYAIAHFMDGRWRVVAGSGGACSPDHAWAVGIPPRLWGQLFDYPISDEDRRRVLGSGPQWTWMTSSKLLGGTDLEGYSFWELTLMRNEIYAIHGREFKDPELKAYFTSRPWYHPDPAYHDGLLTEVERKNAARINEFQKQRELL